MQRFIAVIFFAVILSSCSQESKSSLTIFIATEEGFDQSNKAIANSTTKIYHALDEKLAKPETAQQASVWQPNAMVIKERSEWMISYIEQLIKKLKEAVAGKNENDKIVLRNDGMDAVKRLFIVEMKGDSLYQKLQKYKQDILAVNPEIFEVFGRNSIIITSEFELDSSKLKDFTSTFFSQMPVAGASAILRKFENNVRVLENKLVTFCYNKIGSTDGGGFYTRISPILAISSSYVKTGDKIVISAGIGSFSTETKPVVYMGGKVLQPDENGVVVYKFKASEKIGKNVVPVKIEYTSPNGKREFFNMKAEYTVAE
jgi:gliding motility-associated protein GldM